MTYLDLARIDDAREIDATVAFAQRGAELIEARELAIAELNAEAGRAFDERRSSQDSRPGHARPII